MPVSPEWKRILSPEAKKTSADDQFAGMLSYYVRLIGFNETILKNEGYDHEVVLVNIEALMNKLLSGEKTSFVSAFEQRKNKMLKKFGAPEKWVEEDLSSEESFELFLELDLLSMIGGLWEEEQETRILSDSMAPLLQIISEFPGIFLASTPRLREFFDTLEQDWDVLPLWATEGRWKYYEIFEEQAAIDELFKFEIPEPVLLAKTINLAVENSSMLELALAADASQPIADLERRCIFVSPGGNFAATISLAVYTQLQLTNPMLWVTVEVIRESIGPDLKTLAGKSVRIGKATASFPEKPSGECLECSIPLQQIQSLAEPTWRISIDGIDWELQSDAK